MEDYVIIVAGGVGNRMGGATPKQYLEIGGKPILMHTLERFSQCHPNLQIVVVLHPEYTHLWEQMCLKNNCRVVHKIVTGGKERFHSVKAGLDAIEAENAIVGIHDAVRPFVSNETIEACYDGARTNSTAIPVIPVYDSMRQIEGSANKAVNRKHYRLVQTPQCFEISLLREAYSQPFKETFTDDASVVEALGHKMYLVNGNRENIKITSPSDLIIAEGYAQIQWSDC